MEDKYGIVAMFGAHAVGIIETLSWSVSRAMSPIYERLGDTEPVAYAKGKSLIAGTLIFKTVDVEGIMGELLPPLTFSTSGIDDLRPSPEPVLPGAAPWTMDLLPPFDVILDVETAKKAEHVHWEKQEFEGKYAMLQGVELIEGGYGVGIDDLLSGKPYQYVARAIISPIDEESIRKVLRSRQELIDEFTRKKS